MGDLIDRWRLNQGWNVYDNVTQELAIQSWVNSLNSANVPAEMYHELYENALKLRAKALMNGRDAPRFGVELLLAAWIGGLAQEWEQRRIREKKYLPDVAKTQCKRCYGSGMEWVYTEDGADLGVKAGCKHDPLKPGEWLFKKYCAEDTETAV